MKHMLALCSISWQRNQGNVRERATKRRKINALPGYATQCGIAAKRCYRTKHRLFGIDWLVSVRRCQDMLQRHCLKVDKIAIRQLLGPPMKEVFPKPSFSLHLKQRLQVIRGLQQEYRQRLNHSLQEQVAIELGLHERTDVIASSARLVFHDTETNHPLPAGTTIVQVYDRAQFGLLILGKPGAGKTTLLLDLALELLRRAENDQEHPLPIVLSLSSWGTRKLPFARWLQEQMYLVYGIAKKVGAAWIEQDQILFLLDGLDEMDISARSACVVAMNGHRAEHFVPLVVSSRSQEYEQQHARLILPVAIEIQPLEPAEVMTYLAQAGPTLATARAAIQTNATLQQLMTTPLMLMILLLSYRNQNTNKLAQVGSLEDQQRLIFQHYVQRMLERHHHRRTISQPRLLRSLRWLAQNMQKRHLTEFYLEQLQPTWLPTKQVQTIYHWFYGLFMGLLVGLSMGFMGLLTTAALLLNKKDRKETPLIHFYPLLHL